MNIFCMWLLLKLNSTDLCRKFSLGFSLIGCIVLTVRIVGFIFVLNIYILISSFLYYNQQNVYIWTFFPKTKNKNVSPIYLCTHMSGLNYLYIWTKIHNSIQLEFKSSLKICWAFRIFTNDFEFVTQIWLFNNQNILIELPQCRLEQL